MNPNKVNALLALGLMIVTLCACGNSSASSGRSFGSSEPIAVEGPGETIQEREQRLAVERLKLRQEVELRELREKHRLELERKELERERLVAAHQQEVASLKAKHELEITRLQQEHAFQVAELERQINTFFWLAIAGGSLFLGSWAGLGIFRWTRSRKAQVVADPDWHYRKPPPSVTR